MIALQITATTPHGVVLSRPWGVALDGLLASVLWHRRKWAARAAGETFAYQHSQTPDILDLPLARCGDPEQDADWHWMATFADLHPQPQDATEPDIRWRTSRTDRTRLQHLSPVIGSQAVSDSTGRYQRRIVPVMAHPATSAHLARRRRPRPHPGSAHRLAVHRQAPRRRRGAGDPLGGQRDAPRPRLGGRPRTRARRPRPHRSTALRRRAPRRRPPGGCDCTPALPAPGQPHRGLPAGAVICRQRAGIRCLSDELKHPGASCDSRLAHADRDTTTTPAPTHPPRGAALSPQRTEPVKSML